MKKNKLFKTMTVAMTVMLLSTSLLACGKKSTSENVSSNDMNTVVNKDENVNKDSINKDTTEKDSENKDSINKETSSTLEESSSTTNNDEVVANNTDTNSSDNNDTSSNDGGSSNDTSSNEGSNDTANDNSNNTSNDTVVDTPIVETPTEAPTEHTVPKPNGKRVWTDGHSWTTEGSCASADGSKLITTYAHYYIKTNTVGNLVTSIQYCIHENGPNDGKRWGTFVNEETGDIYNIDKETGVRTDISMDEIGDMYNYGKSGYRGTISQCYTK